jgi:transposase
MCTASPPSQKNAHSRKTSGNLRKAEWVEKDETLERVYLVDVGLTFDPVVVSHEKELLGRSLPGSTDLTIDPDVMLEYYEEQSTVERAFRFIKGARFPASEVYLENENRIAAPAMIMMFCLMGYLITE